MTYLGRAGLYGTPEFADEDGNEFSYLERMSENGYVAGYSERFDVGGNNRGHATWQADPETGATVRTGLFSEPEFTSAIGRQFSSVEGITKQGYSFGISTTYSGSTIFGQAAWATNTSGITQRIGYYGPEFTSTDRAKRESDIRAVTESGYVIGESTRYSGSNSQGAAVWAYDVSTGETTRFGLISGPEFVRNSGQTQSSSVDSWSPRGDYFAGFSARISGGRAAWVGNAATGVTVQVGLSGSEFTSSSGRQNASVTKFTSTGRVGGISERYTNGEFANGQGAWAADVVAGKNWRVGLYQGTEFTGTGGALVNMQRSSVLFLSESGFVAGESERYAGNVTAGSAAWVADIATGTTYRVGFTGSGYTSTFRGIQESSVKGLSENGYAAGYSRRYSGSSSIGFAFWAANVSTGSTVRVGLYSSPEFTGANNRQSGEIDGMTKAGRIVGYSFRYNGGEEVGKAPWVAQAATGETVRIGLHGTPEFTSSATGTQYSETVTYSETHVAGVSQRYDGSSANGQAAWLTEMATGVTSRLGLTDGQYTSATGYQFSTIARLTPDYVEGSSTRFEIGHGDSSTAWLYDLSEGELVAFDHAVGFGGEFAFSYSYLNGITESGIAYGIMGYSLNGHSQTGAFIWTAATDVFLLDHEIPGGVGQYGWDRLPGLEFVSENGVVTGYADMIDHGNSEIYMVNAVPEADTYALLAGGLALFGLLSFRKHARAR